MVRLICCKDLHSAFLYFCVFDIAMFCNLHNVVYTKKIKMFNNNLVIN